MSKADYVRSQGQTRDHHCHWPGCTRQVPPAMWGCRPHWYRLPAELRRRIWRCYQPGQEISGRPSADYVTVAREAQAWIAGYEANNRPQPPARDLLTLAAEIDREGAWSNADGQNSWAHADGRDD